MIGVRLYELLKSAGYDAEERLCGMEITDVAYDSRKVKAGALFVAIKGFKSDGHDFIETAFQNGAAFVVGEKEIARDNYKKVPDSRVFLARVSAAFFNHPADRLKIIGITGTNGKTTASYLIKGIIELKGDKCGLIGTNQILIGNEAVDSVRTTPESRDLHELFAKMEKAGAKWVVMEVSSHSLALDRVYGITFETAVFTNLTRDHLDFHKTMDNYAQAKAKLFSMCRSCAVNVDDEYSSVMLKNAVEPLTYSVERKSNLKAENVKLSEKGVFFDIYDGGKCVKYRLAIPGRFSVYNALSAIAAALNVGFSHDDIVKGLIFARGVKGRLEVLPILTDYTVIIDYAHTPDGLENVLNALRGFAKGRIITLFGCGGDRDKTKRPIMGKIAEEMSDLAIVTSDNPRSEEPGAIIEDILAGMKKDNHTVVQNRREAIGYALDIAKKDDIVLLAGKGHETYQILKDETIHFDEREIVKEILAQKK